MKHPLQFQQYKPCSPQCFDSFNVGPLYRQGPFYQPPYQPPTNCAFFPQGCFTGFGGGGWPALGAFGAGAAQFAPQGFGAGNMGFNGFQATGLPVQPTLDGLPDMWNFTALNSSAATLEAAQPQLVEEPQQNDMPFVYRLSEAYRGRQDNDTDISVVNT
ncbi:hypothetical protein HUJ05_007369 [Dendroctonus ponderosae]|nr:hypothetical protein HUJ05_007369 [Dendroctonus ponderosae]